MPSTMESQLQALRDKDEIREVIFAYGQAADRGDRSLYDSLFTPDAVLHLGVYDGPAKGMMDQLRSKTVTTHIALTNIRIKLDGDRAKATTYISAIHSTPRDGQVVSELARSRYLDVFARHEGRWRIAERTSVRDWHYVLPPSPADAGPGVAGNASRVMGAFGPDDPGFAFLD